MASAALTEPHVLARTKEHLFPDDGDQSYVVTDTQFATDQWIDDRPIDEAVKSRLAPFNHVRIGSGYPDLVGVRTLEEDLLAVDRLGDEPPLIAIEAKGYTGGSVDVERGVVQAYDRLHEANVAYVTAPAESITQSARTLAGELNVGVLAVHSADSIRVLERPRVVGNRTSDEATAIRFQASAQGVADKSFGLNHPKNYLAVPLALYHDGDATTLIENHVVAAVDDAVRGAAFLGLVEEDATPDPSLTPLGQEVVRFALREYASLDAALEDFKGWQRSRKRFIEVAPRWGEIIRRVVFDYPATQLLVEELQQMNDDKVVDFSLVDLVEWLHFHHPTFTVELFIRGTDNVRERVLTEDGDLRTEELEDGNVYHAPTVFQLKAMLYHAGILTERGSEPHRLDPCEDEWQLREPLDPYR